MRRLRTWLAAAFQPRRFHNRANGPAVIDPARRHILHVFGKKP